MVAPDLEFCLGSELKPKLDLVQNHGEVKS